jgi:hypothetical protein
MPVDFERARRIDKCTFYCPSGHPQAYIISEADKLRLQLADKIRLVDQAHARERDMAERLLKAERAKKRLEKRVAAGICPFPGCKRHFTNFQRHVETEHHGQVLAALHGVTEQKLLQ